MATLSRSDFSRILGGSTIEVDALRAEPAMRSVDVGAADHAPRDGVIQGVEELNRLWRGIDGLDRDGNAHTVRASAGSPVRASLEAVSRVAGAPSLRVWEVQGAAVPPTDGRIVLLGMNEGSRHEAQVLRNAGHQVTHLTDAPSDDTIRVAGRTYDLTSREGLGAFVATLDLPAEQAEKVAVAIAGAGHDARDELAALAVVWAKAEKGEPSPGRLVLSGHSVGSGIWGDDNGYLEYTKIAALAEAMPLAARTVKHLKIAGCYSAGENGVNKLRAIFPRVQTIWFYTGSAPGSYSGAEAHLTRWAGATRGNESTLDRNVARGTRKGDSVATWSITEGYRDGNPARPIADLRRRVEVGDRAFAQYFSGEAVVEDTQRGPLRDHYNNLQQLAQHPELTGRERAEVEHKIELTIRLIFYSAMIAPRFASHFAGQIQAGYSELGLPVPNFGTLSRQDALARIDDFDLRVSQGAGGAAARALRPLLVDGLGGLAPSIIPTAWV